MRDNARVIKGGRHTIPYYARKDNNTRILHTNTPPSDGLASVVCPIAHNRGNGTSHF